MRTTLAECKKKRERKEEKRKRKEKEKREREKEKRKRPVSSDNKSISESRPFDTCFHCRLVECRIENEQIRPDNVAVLKLNLYFFFRSFLYPFHSPFFFFHKM